MKSIRKFANKVPFVCGSKKFCFGQHKLVPSSSCNCKEKCEMEKPVYFVSNFKCAFTDEYRVSRDCDCIDNCCATQSELSFYFKN